MARINNDVIIAVMGATGSGKSSLIRLATGDEKVIVGDSLKSATSEVTTFSYDFEGLHFVLVDTPGFDDTFVSDSDVLRNFSQWLANSYRAGTRLSAILYMHRISNPRMQGSALRNFRVFTDLCGEDCFDHVHLCTTFWDLFDDNPVVPEARVDELKEERYWGGMIRKGSHLCKGPRTQLEARELFHRMAEKSPAILKLQKEVVDEGKSIDETAAMLSLLSLELKRQKEEYEEKVRQEKERWEQEIAEKERQRASELEAMRQAFEAKLVAQRLATEKVETDLRRTLSDQEKKEERIRKEAEELRLRKAKTEGDRQFQETVKARQQRLDQFTNVVMATQRILETGRTNRHVRCDLKPIKKCYTMVCSNCLRNVGRRDYYSQCSQTFKRC